MASEIKIDSKTGAVTVDGVVVSPGEVGTVVRDTDLAWREVTNRKNWNIKQIEKGVVYVATVVTTTNVFGQIPLPTGVKEWVLGGAALIIGAIHVSTPKVP